MTILSYLMRHNYCKTDRVDCKIFEGFVYLSYYTNEKLYYNFYPIINVMGARIVSDHVCISRSIDADCFNDAFFISKEKMSAFDVEHGTVYYKGNKIGYVVTSGDGIAHVLLKYDEQNILCNLRNFTEWDIDGYEPVCSVICVDKANDICYVLNCDRIL